MMAIYAECGFVWVEIARGPGYRIVRDRRRRLRRKHHMRARRLRGDV